MKNNKVMIMPESSRKNQYAVAVKEVPYMVKGSKKSQKMFVSGKCTANIYLFKQDKNATPDNTSADNISSSHPTNTGNSTRYTISPSSDL